VTDNLSARRYCAIFLPMLSADRWRRENGSDAAVQPLVFIEKQRGAMRIVAVDETALTLGIAPGMMLADARARVPDLLTVAHDRQADAALLDRIAEDCDRFTPMVALDPPDGLILDITGCAHLWGDEGNLVSAIAARLVHLGLTIRLALAETPDKARALARYGGEIISAGRKLPPESLNEERSSFLAPPLQGRGKGWGASDASLSNTVQADGPHPNPFPKGEGFIAYRPALPITALDLPDDQTTALRHAGLYTIDDLARRPRRPLAARFGMGMIAKLARVLGEEDVRIVPRRMPPHLFFVRRFAEPVAHTEMVLGCIRDLAGEAAIALNERGEGGRGFAISLFRSDGDTRRLTIETGRPTRDPALLDRLFRERIDGLSDELDPGFGYDAIRFDVAFVELLGSSQPGLDGDDRGDGDVDALTDRLGVRLGHTRVRRFASGNSHIPECASFTIPANAPTLPMPWPAPEPGEPPLRPIRLFDPPQRVEVIAEVPDGPPRRFRWRRQMHDVIAHEGPERIASEWWKRRDMTGLTRDYYRVEDARGRRFWLFRHGLYGGEKPNPDWYVHGTFG
jgi:protein ImuB